MRVFSGNIDTIFDYLEKIHKEGGKDLKFYRKNGIYFVEFNVSYFSKLFKY